MQLSSARSSLFLAFEHVNEQLRQRALGTFTKIRLVMVEKHEALQEALHDRENRLLKLLADSSDAIVVIDGQHRLLDANSRALALLGISRTNIEQFTIDAFLSSNNISHFERSGPPFFRGRECCGECQIRRLDGSRRKTKFSFQANFVPGRHVCRFRCVTFEKAEVEAQVDRVIAKIIAVHEQVLCEILDQPTTGRPN